MTISSAVVASKIWRNPKLAAAITNKQNGWEDELAISIGESSANVRTWIASNGGVSLDKILTDKMINIPTPLSFSEMAASTMGTCTCGTCSCPG